MRHVPILLLLALTACAGDMRIQHVPTHEVGVRDPQFLRTLNVLGGPSPVAGNRIDYLENGVKIFPAMLDAIRGSQVSVTFMTYIYWSGQIGHDFAAALADRARAGVKVHVLVDWLGSGRMDEGDIELMKQAGVEFEKFRPLSWWQIERLNNRLHRKLLICDGRIGFTGGVGIATQWTGDAEDREHWRDSHFRIEGPVVTHMQAAFMENWLEATGRVLSGREYFPPVAPAGDATAQVFASSPTGGGDAMEVMYLLAIAAAEESICLSSAYFIPGDLERLALMQALKRGVRVEIVVPGEYMDVETVRRASRARWGDLLFAGARIYEYQLTMYHCKVLVVDGFFVSVGSTNFDPRSFRLNDEVNVNVYDEAFGRAQLEVFRRDVAESVEIDYETWKSRPWTEKLVEHTAALFESLL